MQVAVLIEPVQGRGYRASSEAFSLSVEGSTEEEALERIEKALGERLASGTRIVTVNVPTSGHPAVRYFGTLPKDDLYDEWIKAMEDRRRLIDEDENAL